MAQKGFPLQNFDSIQPFLFVGHEKKSLTKRKVSSSCKCRRIPSFFGMREKNCAKIYAYTLRCNSLKRGGLRLHAERACSVESPGTKTVRSLPRSMLGGPLAQPGRALRLHRRGRGFKSHRVHTFSFSWQEKEKLYQKKKNKSVCQKRKEREKRLRKRKRKPALKRKRQKSFAQEKLLLQIICFIFPDFFRDCKRRCELFRNGGQS